MPLLDSLAVSLGKLFGVPATEIWPISTESAPFLVALWLLLASLMYFGFLRQSQSSDIVKAINRRKERKFVALKNLIFLENTRLVNLLSKDDEKVDTSDKPPKACDVFAIIFEKVEEEPTYLVLGIAETDPWYLRGVSLFKMCLAAELEETVTKTRQAQTLDSLMQDAALDDTVDYADGSKLATLLQFIQESAVKHFGTHKLQPLPTDQLEGIDLTHFDQAYVHPGKELMVVGPKALNEATKLLEAVRAAQKSAVSHIFDVLRPVMPTYLGSLVFLLLGRMLEAPVWATTLPAFQNSITRVNENATLGDVGYGPAVLAEAQGHALYFIVGYLFLQPIDMIAGALENTATHGFSLPLRTAVIKAIMKQDTEYFDRHNAAALQERLNSDTNELVRNLLWVPKNIFLEIFRVVNRMYLLHYAAPDMLWACLSFNVPMFAAFTVLTNAPLRRLLVSFNLSPFISPLSCSQFMLHNC